MKAMQKGFTLIELMITLVVLGILLSFGVPSFTAWIQDSRVDGTAQNIATVLKLARSEAVARQRVVTVNWSNGDIYMDADGAGDGFGGTGDIIIKDGITLANDGVTISSSTDDNFVSFRANGTLNNGTLNEVGAIAITITVCDSHGEAQGWDIDINIVGRITLTHADCSL